MRLSVIIVSYNVYPFLENCLRSVHQALENINGEIIVVDNASVDRTQQFLTEHFPSVTLIANKENIGFAKANNQGIDVSKGEYVVLLNPDTIVSEDTFSTCLEFMDAHPEAGAAGVRMLDGSGTFLPESKRGLPTLRASFMKMTGLYKLFPTSSFLNSYYMGNIGEMETAKVEVLCGAFMFIRKKTLLKTGLLDEDFFMYGEDIDLSYRITESGADIYYLPETSIVHYKGESTKKSSLNYILTFYQAMLIFTAKHGQFSGQKFLIKTAIYLHGFIQFLRQTMAKWWPPVLDAVLFSLSFFLMARIWASYYYHVPDYFTRTFYYFNIPLYTVIAIAAMFLNGAYDKPYLKKTSWLGFVWAVISILVIYAFLPIPMRTSRMVIVLGSLLFMMFLILTRWKFPPWNSFTRRMHHKEERRAVIVAGQQESGRIKELINRSRDHIDIVGTVSPESFPSSDDHQTLGSFSQLRDIVRVHRIKEIIFSAQDVPFTTFTSGMTSMGPGYRYMLAASSTMNIVGSMNRDTEGESYAIRVDFKLSHAASLRAKRIFDIVTSMILLALAPILLFTLRPIHSLWKNIFDVLSGNRTWISYHPDDPSISSLPSLRRGILSPQFAEDEGGSSRRLQHIHYVYARDYHWTTDLSLMVAQWKKIGRNPLSYG